MSGLTWDGMAESASRDQIIKKAEYYGVRTLLSEL